MTVSATFTGRNGYKGLVTGQRYTFTLERNTVTVENWNSFTYGSTETFLKNWKEILVIT